MVWFLPSYGRPQQCAETLLSVQQAKCSTPGVVLVNGEDQKEAYMRHVVEEDCLPTGWTIQFSKNNLGFVGGLNYLFGRNQAADFYGFISDDETVESKYWDRELVKAAGDWSVSNAYDGWQSKARIHGTPVIAGNLVRAVGYMAIPTTWHHYGYDDLWESLDKYLAIRRYCPDVKVRHNHFLLGKQPRDATTEAAESRAQEDKLAFQKWTQQELFLTVKRIKRLRGF